MIYLLSTHTAQKMELIKNLSGHAFVRILKLCSTDPSPMSAPIYLPWHTPLTPPPDLWTLLEAVLRNPSPIFSSLLWDQLISALSDDIRVHLMLASSYVRDVDTEHPYLSGSKERGGVRVDGASHLLVTFDRRSNLNASHACLTFYRDASMAEEIAAFSGSADEFAPIVIPGDSFHYSFVSGDLRQKPSEFGFRFRVVPLGFKYRDEKSVLESHLGWPVLSIISDMPGIIDDLFAMGVPSVGMNLVLTLIRYLTVVRSPEKVMVTRALSKMCMRISKPIMPGANFEQLLRVMDQLYDSNTASGWGASPFLQVLVDLMRVRPIFKLTDADLWNVESAEGRPPGWFYLTTMRVESVSKSLLSSTKLPGLKVFERAYNELADIEILRWAMKQPELCLKLNKQSRTWNGYRRDWMQLISAFHDPSSAANILIALKQSLLPECYRTNHWAMGSASKDWEDRCKRASSFADIASAYIELEAALKWGDQFPEQDRAFGDAWASRRSDWIATMNGLARSSVVKVVTPQEAFDYRWNRAMDEQLVAYIDNISGKSARRLMSLTFRDLEAMKREDSDAFPLIRHVPIEHIRARFAVLKMLATDYMSVMPVVDISYRDSWSLSPIAKSLFKTLTFHQTKMFFWTSLLSRLFNEDRPQFVILNRHMAQRPRSDESSKLANSLFFQLYTHIGRLCDPSSLRRRGQAFMVKFVQEGGHDVGGLYNESLVDICNELQSETPTWTPNTSTSQPLLPLFRLCPNGRNNIGENRSKYIPNPQATSPQHIELFEFLGRLMGICTLDNNRALPLDLPSCVWKTLCGETLDIQDLKAIDHSLYTTLSIMRHPDKHKLTPENFSDVFPGLTFIASNSVGDPVELMPNGSQIPVSYENMHVYVSLIERMRLSEFIPACSAIMRGMASVIPLDYLSIFTWKQLETQISGSPYIDIDLLKSKTEYRGSLTYKDKHVSMFWDVLTDFTQEERRNFLQFVWGRNRLPSSALGFGRDMFKLSDHVQASAATNQNVFLPVAHTCFFALELPRYSSREIMRAKLLYAITNCTTIDGDSTHEGRANMNMGYQEEED